MPTGRLELDPNKGLPQADRSQTWADPIVGARAALDLTEHWAVVTEADFGGFGVGSEFTWNAQAFLGYRMSIAGRPTPIGAGYRALSWDYESGDFKWDVIQHGPIIGAALRFWPRAFWHSAATRRWQRPSATNMRACRRRMALQPA